MLRALKSLFFILLLIYKARADGPLNSIKIQVKDKNNLPVASCLVQVGQKPQSPFLNNLSVTDPEGSVEFKQISVIQFEPITLVCPKRPTVTYLKQSGQSFNLVVGDLQALPQASIEAHFEGWNNVGQNGNVDLALITPVVSQKGAFSLQWSDLVSPKMDIMTVFGKDFEVPSNIHIPKQKVRWGLLSTQIEKDRTHYYIEKNKNLVFMSIAGKLPSSELIQSYLGGEIDYFSLINFMDFYSLSITEKPTDSSAIHLTVNQYKLKPCMSLQVAHFPPKLKPLGALLNTITVNNSSVWAATDIKLLGATPQTLKCLDSEASPPAVTILATNEDTSVTSQVLIRKPSASMNIHTFFSTPQIKVLNGGKALEFSKAENETVGFKASGFQATLSDDKLGPRWFVFSGNDLSQPEVEKFELPQLPDFFSQQTEPEAVIKQKWEVMWLGIDPQMEPQATSQNIDFNFFGAATHASKNSLTY